MAVPVPAKTPAITNAAEEPAAETDDQNSAAESLANKCWGDYCPCDTSDPDYGYADIPICRNLKMGVPVDDGVMAGGAASHDARRALREHEDQYGAF